MTRETAIEKVRKLRAMAEPGRGATDNERDVATRKATMLIERHALTETELTPPPAFDDLMALFRPRAWVPTAVEVAEQYHLDPVAFRRWLRRHGISGVERELAFTYRRNEVVEEFRHRRGA